DNYYDYSLVNENYARILHDYPKSKYVEEIEFYHAGIRESDEGTEYSEEAIHEIDSFLKKYPHTVFKPQLKIRKANILSAYSGEIDDMIYFKEKAIEELRKIKLETIKDT